jgi:hypothetical protein
VTFAVEPRTGEREPIGSTMHHGRVAVALAALCKAGRAHAAVRARASKRLERDIRGALRGGSVPGWPEEPALVAGTLALAVRAGIDVRSELAAFARERRDLGGSPWHAAQVCAALGRSAPPALYAAAVRGLDQRTWAPWTMMAAEELGDAPTRARCEAALVASIRDAPPHVGGANVTAVPELALTAVVAEALARSRSRVARAAVARARSFLRRWQLVGDHIPGELDVAIAGGAFPISPIISALRCDVTGHAVLALQGIEGE